MPFSRLLTRVTEPLGKVLDKGPCSGAGLPPARKQRPQLGWSQTPILKQLDTLSLALAKELGPKNIRINVVLPATPTPIRPVMMRETDFGKGLISAVPLGGRLGRPDGIVPSVVFLASDEAAWLTGERFHASGGVH